LNEQPCDLRVLMTEAVAEQRRAWPGREILVSLPSGEASAWCDPPRVKQLAAIFLSNALKFAPPTRPVRLALEWFVDDPATLVSDGVGMGGGASSPGPRSEAGWARIAVTDEGPGLSPEQQTQVWERFARIEGINQQQGSGVGVGLGLYIAQAIVAQHGGRIGVESAPGHGATFWCEAPILTGVSACAPRARQIRRNTDET
jgi:signal transduction histidine kinase